MGTESSSRRDILRVIVEFFGGFTERRRAAEIEAGSSRAECLRLDAISAFTFLTVGAIALSVLLFSIKVQDELMSIDESAPNCVRIEQEIFCLK
jgi:hypothetical protein